MILRILLFGIKSCFSDFVKSLDDFRVKDHQFFDFRQLFSSEFVQNFGHEIANFGGLGIKVSTSKFRKKFVTLGLSPYWDKFHKILTIEFW